jgi:predicted AlkP superfamily pyrophosphatase or phosphodiesterase
MTVILITLDGVRPDAILQANTPTLKHIMAQGAYTLKAQSVMPSVTLPCHTSIFHSVPPQRHGILDNTYHALARPLPGIYEQVRSAKKRSAAFFAWEPLRDLGRPLSVSHSVCIEPKYPDIEYSDHPLVKAALPYIENNTYDFIFLYIGSTDEVGHRDGWMSAGYLKQVEIADELLAQVLAVLSDDSHILIEADHGGHDRNHGTESPDDMTIPWLVYGANIRKGHEIQADVSLLNTAPTVARLLNIEPAQQWDGTVVDEIFMPST